MTPKAASTAREALVAELLGDVQTILDRIDGMYGLLQSADDGAKTTATAIQVATNEYRKGIDDTVARLRVETAAIISQTTEHAARCLVDQQTSTLKLAAVEAIRQTLTSDIIKTAKRYIIYSIVASSVISALMSFAFIAVWR